MTRLSLLLALLLGGAATTARASAANISNVLPRRDTSGAIMDMHDGNVHVGDDGTIYWYAAGYGGCPERSGTTGCAGGFKGCGFYNNHSVNLFTSKDLTSWTSHGNVLPAANRVDAILFSPKILFNKQTATYVLWYNFVPHYSYAVATSKSPFGPFITVNSTVGSSFRFGHHNNTDIGDFSLWADDDGTGYMLYSAHAHCQVERLTPDYLASTWETTNESSPVFPHGNEAPALFKREGKWYALVSESCCYCKPGGKVHAYSATDPLGPYDYLGEIAAGSNPQGGEIATSAQQTNVFPVKGQDGSLSFIWQGDRWQSAPDHLKSHDFTYWDTLSFTADGAIERLTWRDWFTVDVAAGIVPTAANALLASPKQQGTGCFNNCTHLTVVDGYLTEPSHTPPTFVGSNWSSIQALIDARLGPAGDLPGLDANASTMRQLTLTGDYVADVPLNLPSRLHFRLNGKVHGNLTADNQEGPNACRYGFQYHGKCALIEIAPGVSFVSVTGGTYSCDGATAFGVSCQGCNNALIQNVTVTGCTDGNIHTFGAGPAVEIKNVDSSGSNRGFWSMRPSAKLLITDSYFHHNGADGIDLDSLSEHVMIRNNRLENNGRAGVFIEEGASMNIVVDNHFFNNTYGVSFYTNMGGKDPGKFPTADNWIVGNSFVENENAFSLGGMRENGATDNLIAENDIHGNGAGWAVNGAMVGNHVMTSDTDDPRGAHYANYGAGNVTFFAEPPTPVLAADHP